MMYRVAVPVLLELVIEDVPLVELHVVHVSVVLLLVVCTSDVVCVG